MRSISPLVAQQLPAPAPDLDFVVRAGHGVEASGEHDGVELVLAVPGAHPGRGDLLERRFLHVHELDVVAVEYLVVAVLEGHPLGAERVVAGGKLSAVAGSSIRSAILSRTHSETAPLASLLTKMSS